MELIVDQVGTVTVVIPPVFDLDASNVREFKEAIGLVLVQDAHIVLDMSRLGIIDSSGLGAILSCLRKLETSRGVLKLCGLSKQIQSLFELVKMHRILDIYKTKEEAIQAFQS